MRLVQFLSSYRPVSVRNRDGSFYVSDGYCNSRVVNFSKEGKYMREAKVEGGKVSWLGCVVEGRSVGIIVRWRKGQWA